MSNVYLTQAEVAERWGFSVSTLAYWRSKEIGPKYHRRGLRQIVYELADIVDYEKKNPALVVRVI